MQNLFDKASLVMVPSGYDNGKLYNIKPENKDSAFEFERATAATRVDSSGIVETFHPEATNLLLQSNQFNETVWPGYLSTVTPNQQGYDGSNDAWLLERNGAFGLTRQFVSISGPHTFSIYLKKGSLNWAYLRYRLSTTSGYSGVYFDLENAEIGGTGTTISQNIKPVGYGFYRCSITFNQPLSEILVYPVESNGSVGGSSVGNIYIQDAQLETGYFATPYIETTTEAVTRQNKANQPRIDYTSGEGTLLLEPQRTNLFTDSVGYAGMTYLGTSHEFVSITSPDGTTNGVKRVTATTTNQARIEESLFPSTLDANYTWSIFVKKDTARYVGLSHFSENSNKVVFDLDNGTIVSEGGSLPAKIEAFSNGWYRISKGAYLPSGIPSSGFKFHLSTEGSIFTSVVGESAFVYGFQIEQGAYATSYIPTNGQTETRVGELWQTKNLNDVIDTADGFSFFMEISATELTEVGYSDFFAFRVSDSNSDYIKFEMRSNGTVALFSSLLNYLTLDDVNEFVIGQVNKIGFTITNNTQKLFINGVLTESNTQSITLPTFEQLKIEHSPNQPSQKKYGLNQMIAFQEVLLDEELQRLTSLSADATTFTELANNNGYTIL